MFSCKLYEYFNRACAREKMSKKAIQLLQDAKRSGMPLDAFIYTATIDGEMNHLTYVQFTCFLFSI